MDSQSYTEFVSSAIKSIDIKEQECIVVFNSNHKQYLYRINDNSFEESLRNTIQNKESIGIFVNNAIKNKIIEQINTTVD